MIWDHENRRPVPGSFRPKHALLDRLLLDGWLQDDPSGRAADGLLEFILDEGIPLDETLEKHYLDIENGHLKFRKDIPKEELYMRLYFCDSEEDIWDMAREGLGVLDSFLYSYAGYPSADARETAPLTASEDRLIRFGEYVRKAIPMIGDRITFLMNMTSTFSPKEFSIVRWTES